MADQLHRCGSQLVRFREGVPWIGLSLALLLSTENSVETLPCPVAPPAPALEVHSIDPQPSSKPEPVPEPSTEPSPAPETTSEAIPPTPAQLMLMLDPERVQLTANVEASWGQGPLRARHDDLTVAAERDVVVARLPASIRDLIGARIDVYGTNGKLCEAKIVEPRLLMRFDGWIDEFLEEGPELEKWQEGGELPPNIEQRLTDAFTVSLVADVRTTGDCDGAVWARKHKLPRPTVLARVQPSPTETEDLEQVRQAVRQSENFRTMREAYLIYAKQQGLDERADDILDWSEFLRAHDRIEMWRDAVGLHQWAHVVYGEFDNSCGEGFDFGVAELWPLSPTDKLTSFPTDQHVAAIVDANGDGQLEIVIGTELDREVVEPGGETLISTRVPFWGCPC